MWVYVLLICIVCIDFAIEFILKRNNVIGNKDNILWKRVVNFVFKYRILTIISLVFLSTFRSLTVGLDTLNYYAYYKILLSDKSLLFKTPISNKFEVGYTILNSLFALCNINFRVLLLIISLFVSITLIMFVNKISSNKLMSIILYIALGVFAQSLNTIRQIIAMAFILIAIMKLVDKKWISAILFILAGTLFHVTALVCLILIPIYFVKPKWWIIVTMFALTIAGSFAFPHILKFIEKVTFLDYYSEYFINYTGYINKSNLINTLYSIGLISLFIIMYLVRLTHIIKLDVNEEKLYDFFLLMYMFVPLCRIIGYIVNIPQLINRISMYFFLSLLILIPLFVKGLKHKKKLYITTNCMIYLVAVGYMYYLYAIKLSCGVVPYIFCF